jgi:diacylglycerol kinase family enzyme
MVRRFGFLVNPTSGGGSAGEAVVPLARKLREAGADVSVTYTTSVAETAGLVAATVAEDRIVVSVGGDGMLSSVAGAVAEAAGTLAVVPAGRGNDFARMLGVPHDAEAQARLLLEGEPRPVDLLEARLPEQPVRWVAGSVYSGVDARAAAIVDRSHWLPQKAQYPVAALRALATYRPAAVTLDVDGVVTTHLAATVVIANSGYYGKGMRIAPAADLRDGLLDVVVIEAGSRREMVRALPSVYDGSHVDRAEVHVLRGRSVRLSGQYLGGTPVPVGADGEALGDLPDHGDGVLAVAVRPAAVRILG